MGYTLSSLLANYGPAFLWANGFGALRKLVEMFDQVNADLTPRFLASIPVNINTAGLVSTGSRFTVSQAQIESSRARIVYTDAQSDPGIAPPCGGLLSALK